jgi:hypothetical protein
MLQRDEMLYPLRSNSIAHLVNLAGAAIQSNRMLMGFLGYSDRPPGKVPPPPEDPHDGSDDADDARRKREESLRRSKSRFASRATKAGKYAWLISLSLHGALILCALGAAKYYFSRPRSQPSALEPVRVDSGSFVAGADSTDAVHSLSYGPAFLAGVDLPSHDSSREDRNLPTFWFEAQTLASLQDDMGASGQFNPATDMGKSPNFPQVKASHADTAALGNLPAATQPGVLSNQVHTR